MRNKLKVEYDLSEAKHKLKILEDEKIANTKELNIERREVQKERTQRLLDIHRCKIAEDERNSMERELSNMKLLADDALKNERRFIDQIKPLQQNIEAARHLADYYEENEMKSQIALREAQNIVEIEKMKREKADNLRIKAEKEYKHILDCYGKLQAQCAHLVSTATQKSNLITPQKNGKGVPKAGGIGQNWHWEHSLGTAQVLESFGLLNMACFKPSVLTNHNAEKPRYMSETLQSLVRSGAQFVDEKVEEASMESIDEDENTNLPKLNMAKPVTSKRKLEKRKRKPKFTSKRYTELLNGSGYIGRGLGIRKLSTSNSKIKHTGFAYGSVKQVITNIRKQLEEHELKEKKQRFDELSNLVDQEEDDSIGTVSSSSSDSDSDDREENEIDKLDNLSE